MLVPVGDLHTLPGVIDCSWFQKHVMELYWHNNTNLPADKDIKRLVMVLGVLYGLLS